MDTWIVTGGTRGLGRAMADCLIDSGDAVAFCARTPNEVAQVEQELKARGAALGMAGSIADRTFVRDFVEGARTLGGLRGLILNAAVLPNPPVSPVLSLGAEEVRRVLDVNLLGALHLLQAAHPYLIRHDNPRVAAITSDASWAQYPGWAAYGMSKAALELLVLTYGAEHGDVPALALDPGDMDTAMHREALPDDDGELRDPKAMASAIVALLGRPSAVTGRWVFDGVDAGYVSREVK